MPMRCTAEKALPIFALRTACVASLAVVLSACTSVPTDDGIRIGLAAPLTGSIRHLGRDVERGAQLAVEEVNGRSIVVGGKPLRLSLISQDDAGMPQQGITAANALVSQKVNAVIGHLNSGTSIPAARVYDAAGVPQISPSATNPKLTRMGFERVFRMVADDVQLAEELGRYAVNRLGARRIMVVDDRSAYGQGIADVFERTLLSQGAVVLPRQFANKSATSLTLTVDAIAAQGPDLVFYGGMDIDLGKLIRSVAQRGLRPKWIGGDGICSGELPKFASGLADDQVYCAEGGGPPLKPSLQYQEFADRFTKKFGSAPILYASNTYDSVQAVVAAMVAAGSTDSKIWVPYLRSTPKLLGANGVIEFDASGNLRQPYVSFFTYRRDSRVQIE
ncbi:MAG: branched chain amino acid ABC transporter substrate-binding protein [Ideonella sp. MAG2]|nr:MAG: branched chain amino acid ABC transporter substrate-binding protein [Ideonella sp. MAG2]